MPNNHEIVRKVESYLNRMTELGRFSGSVLLAQNHEILHCAGYGRSNWEHNVANIPETKFRIGSISKQFTAMAVLILQERGMLNVDDPITKHLKDAPNTWDSVRIRHLLNHTSGVESLTEFVDQRTTARLPMQLSDWIDTFRERPLQFKPGSQHHYSNSGYLLLGDIVERVSGTDYESFLSEHIFGPLGMQDSGYDTHEKILIHRASGYRKRDGHWGRGDYLDMGFPFAAGALFSTVNDLFLWDQALHNSRLVSQQTIDRMSAITPLVAPYGFGTVIGNQFNRKTLGHAGGINGFRANLVRYVDEPACVIALCNTEESDFLGTTEVMAAILFGELYKVPMSDACVQIDEQTMDSYSGTYRVAPEINITVEFRQDRMVVISGDAETDFELKSRTYFKSTDRKTTVEFEASDQQHLVLRQDGVPVQAERILA